MIKCVGCYDLVREEYRLLEGKALVAYKCPRFPYSSALSGLFRPGKHLLEAVGSCPKTMGEHCMLCEEKGVPILGLRIVSTCDKHHQAWGKWLNEHPGKREYIRPEKKGARLSSARWIEVFREFIEECRSHSGA